MPGVGAAAGGAGAGAEGEELWGGRGESLIGSGAFVPGRFVTTIVFKFVPARLTMLVMTTGRFVAVTRAG